MLRPKAVQEALTTLLETASVPADSALVAFSDSGTIYSQAHIRESSQIADTPTFRGDDLKVVNESQRLQRVRQPGLASFLGNTKLPQHSTTKPTSPASHVVLEGKENATAESTTAIPMMELQMNEDERSKAIAALACQSWMEETNRVKRLFTKVHGHSTSGTTSESGLIRSFSASTGGGGTSGSGNNNGNGKAPSRLRRIEQNSVAQSGIDQLIDGQSSEKESVAAPVAVPGTMLSIGSGGQGVAPLLLEGELGAILVMPLHHHAITTIPSSPSLLQSSPPLLLILSSRPTQHVMTRTAKEVSGTSILSQQQWNDLHDSAHAFAMHVSPALRKAFGREEVISGERDEVGDGATISDIESSIDMEGEGITLPDHGLGIGGIPVR